MSRTTTLALLTIALAAGACRPPATETEGKSKAVDPAESSADQIFYGLRHKVTAEGVRKADLFSDTAFTRPNDPKVQLRGVRLSFFDANGTQNGTLTSRTGEYDMNGGEMIARGNAVLVLQEKDGPRTVRTDELHYDQKADRVWSDKQTTVEQNGKTITSQTFTSDTRFQVVRGTNARSNEIQVKGGGGL